MHRALAALGLVCCAPMVLAQSVLPNNYGEIGLLQTPTARLGADGDFRLGISMTYPYNALLFSADVFPFLEFGFRYTQINNRLFGPVAFSGDQSFKDRAVDFKLKLRDESASWPALALGLRDLGGTGLLAGEYLVASRRYYDFDFSLGLGWGRLGARGDIRNPLSFLSSSFESRTAQTGQGGTVKVGDFFSGREVSLFGGVAWKAPVRNLSLLLEFDGNDYQAENQNNNQRVRFPVNFAASYKLWDSLFLSLGLERGDQATARILLLTNFQEVIGIAKFNDPAPLLAQSTVTEKRPLNEADLKQMSEAMQKNGTSLLAADAQSTPGELSVVVSGTNYRDDAKMLGRSLRILSHYAPQGFNYFNIVQQSRGLPVRHVGVLRSDVEAVLSRARDASEIAARVQVGSGGASADPGFPDLVPHPKFDWSMGPSLRQHIGGPDDFFFAQVWWQVNGKLFITPQWDINSTVGLDIVNNFDGLKLQSNSVLPKVRSDIVQYIKQGTNNLVRLETNYVFSPITDWYGRVSAGIFEEMYGGIAAEVLYRPFGRSWAISWDVNRVRQREFRQRLAFRDYEVTTGHVTLFWDIPGTAIEAKLSGGQYLAGDRGFTLDLSRRFKSGIRLGAFATKTNVSAEDFGEGSFDKGFYVTFPLDLFFTRSRQDDRLFLFRPLTRDGGQKVRDGVDLYSLTKVRATDAAELTGPSLLE